MTLKRWGAVPWLVFYCGALWFIIDYIYTAYADPPGSSPRVYSPIYSHGLLPNFEGKDRWGAAQYRFVTNSLGFRDAALRDVPLKATTRRILLIGDSFTEGTGVPFEQSFAGRLQAAGQAHADRVEFLNAGVIGYRPTIYYKKIKYFIERGLVFDEVIVFSDISDVADEATANACLDDRAQRPTGCIPLTPAPPRISQWDPRDHFNMSIRVFNIVRYWANEVTGTTWDQIIENNQRAIWTIVGALADDYYQPLGVEGGIQRSVAGMQALADLLRSRQIPLSIAVYPWPTQLARNDRNSRQAKLWQDFCRANCKDFINLFPAFFAFKDAHPEWYTRLFIRGDVHFSIEGNKLVYEEIARHTRVASVGDVIVLGETKIDRPEFIGQLEKQ